MRGGDNDSAGCEVVAHNLREPALRRCVERGVLGSSSNQIGRETATIRATDSLRRGPAERYAAGRSARGTRSSSSRAGLMSLRDPRNLVQNCKFSATVGDGFIASW